MVARTGKPRETATTSLCSESRTNATRHRRRPTLPPSQKNVRPVSKHLRQASIHIPSTTSGEKPPHRTSNQNHPPSWRRNINIYKKVDTASDGILCEGDVRLNGTVHAKQKTHKLDVNNTSRKRAPLPPLPQNPSIPSTRVYLPS